MRQLRIFLTTITLAVLPALATAQWVATGDGGLISMGVGCDGNDRVITLSLQGSAAFQDGAVEVQWSDGQSHMYAFEREPATMLHYVARPASNLLPRLRSQASVQVGITTAQGEWVTDSISLTGSSATIGSLPCVAVTAAPQISASEIRRILVSRSIGSYSGSCPCPYNRDRAGRSCGRRSAYSRPGGASPLCYPGDVSDSAVAAYRTRMRR